MVGLRVALGAVALCLAVPQAAVARPLLGVTGNPDRFQQLTGQRSTVVQKIVGWGQGDSWGSPFADLFATMGEVPLLSITMDAKSGAPAIDSRRIASGAGDSYLAAVNAAVAEWGERIYVRPFFEADAFWSSYCAYTQAGRAKGVANATAAFRRAFARTYLILHGGPASRINVSLLRLGMPPLRVGDLPENPAPRLKVIWSPQAYAVPELAGNQPQRYYPGDAYVDVVGNTIYGEPRIKWAEQETYYKRFAKKPFAIPEWALWQTDDPQYIRDMAQFARTHARLELLVYDNGRPGSLFDLALRPKSLAAYRSSIVPLGR
ncbi:MAG TPA: hypothetical protein VF101_02295 [Gaiellaceae bacterium]